MKLKRIISCVLTIIMISGTITLVNAADTKLVVGTPINLSNEDADVLSTGDIIAIPVDVIVGDTYSDKLRGLSIAVKYDDSLTPGVDVDDTVQVSNEVYEKLTSMVSESAFVKSEGGIMGVLNNMYTTSRSGAKTYIGTTIYNPKYESDMISYAWSNATSDAIQVKAEDHEAYLIFVVNKAIDYEKLNNKLLSYVSISYNQITDENDKIGYMLPVDDDAVKLNPCAGAFQVTIDGSKVPGGTWIKNVYAQQKDNTDKRTDLSPVAIKGDTDIYEFPARVNIPAGSSKTSADEVTYEIYAETSATKGGVATDVKKIGDVTVKLDGTVTAYTANTVTNAQ